LHQDLSGILNTLHTGKTDIFQSMNITTSSSKAKDLRSNIHIKILARNWNNKDATTWHPWRKSDTFEAYPGQLKNERGTNIREDSKTVINDPLRLRRS
jgi:hypothetical protein